MKLSLILSILLLFVGCDEVSKYESYEECLLKEVQECSPSNCRREAKDFCENYQGKQYSKAFRDHDLKQKKCEEEATDTSWVYSPKYKECMKRGN